MSEYNQLNQKLLMLQTATEKLATSMDRTIEIHEKCLDLAIIFETLYFYFVLYYRYKNLKPPTEEPILPQEITPDEI